MDTKNTAIKDINNNNHKSVKKQTDFEIFLLSQELFKRQSVLWEASICLILVYLFTSTFSSCREIIVHLAGWMGSRIFWFGRNILRLFFFFFLFCLSLHFMNAWDIFNLEIIHWDIFSYRFFIFFFVMESERIQIFEFVYNGKIMAPYFTPGLTWGIAI